METRSGRVIEVLSSGEGPAPSGHLDDGRVEEWGQLRTGETVENFSSRLAMRLEEYRDLRKSLQRLRADLAVARGRAAKCTGGTPTIRTSHQLIAAIATMLQVTSVVVLLLFIQCQAMDVKVQDNFDESKFAGKWYGIIAASNCPIFHKMKHDMTLPIIVYAVDGHTVKTSVAFKTPEGCKQMDATLETITSGHYKHHSVHGDNEIIIAKTDYQSIAMEYTKIIHEGASCITLKLYGREMNVPEDIKHTFIEHIHKMGLADEDILIFHQGDECVPSGI
ncbi:olfactory protein-like [Rhinoderma darwinii]|uniref:olfactory protein-like n=1 Tax=Rhinoderma darwinii TaxID=43563 RepID=UPI003F67B86A